MADDTTYTYVDSRLNTETSNLNFYINHNFNLFKSNHSIGLSAFNSETIDLLFEENMDDTDYISPSSMSDNYNLSFRSFISNNFNTDIYF